MPRHYCDGSRASAAAAGSLFDEGFRTRRLASLCVGEQPADAVRDPVRTLLNESLR